MTMAIEIRVPTLGESRHRGDRRQVVQEGGRAVKADEPLVELETDKVTVEVPAPAAGVLADIKVAEGATVAVGARARRSISEGGRRPRSRRRPRPQPPRRQAAAAAPRRRPQRQRRQPSRGRPTATCRPRPPRAR